MKPIYQPYNFQNPTNMFNYFEYENHRKQYLKQKTLKQLKNTSQEQIMFQFRVLDSAFVPDQLFCHKEPQNNRYCDIFPYKHSKVKIQCQQNFHTNANYVKSLVDNQVFAIFSQAPYNKFDSFWKAVYYNNVTTIFMLCGFYEQRFHFYQAHQYWPKQSNQQYFWDKRLKVVNNKVTNISKDLYLTDITIIGDKGEKKIRHFQWIGWKDLDQPVDEDLKTFELLLNQCKKQINENRLPWIHCSAGIGRTGTFGGTVDAIRYLQKNKKISIFQLVQNMRKYRIWAVQTQAQYKFLYKYLSRLQI